MPCNDITEIIEIQWDADDRLVWYRLNKRTCGAEIGQESLLLPMFVGRTAEEILALDTEALVTTYADMAESDEFLYFKHLFAMHAAVSVMIGQAEGHSDQACETVAVSWEDDVEAAIQGLRFVGFVSVTEVTKKIKACGGCGSCGSKRKQVDALAVS